MALHISTYFGPMPPYCLEFDQKFKKIAFCRPPSTGLIPLWYHWKIWWMFRQCRHCNAKYWNLRLLKHSLFCLKFYFLFFQNYHLTQHMVMLWNSNAWLVLCKGNSWWQIDSPHKGPVTWIFYDFFVGCWNKMLEKESSCWWFETTWLLCAVIVMWTLHVNHLCAKFFRGNINMYLHFMSFLDIDLTQVLKILPQVREGLTYSI